MPQGSSAVRPTNDFIFTLFYVVATPLEKSSGQKSFIDVTQLNVGRNSSVGIATRYWLDGSGIESRCGAKFSAPVRTGPGAQPASCAVGSRSFQGVKRPGRGVEHPSPSSPEAKEREELYLCSPFGPSWLVLWRSSNFHLIKRSGMY